MSLRAVQHCVAMMMTRPYARAALACLLAFTMASAAGAPKAVKASYSVFMNGLAIGAMSEHFEIDGTAYRIASDTRPIGAAALIQRQSLRFQSHGRIIRSGLQPRQFEARRSAGEPPQVSAEFDWNSGQIELRRGGKTQTLALPDGTQDRLSIMYQFMFLPLENARHIEFPMTDGRKLDRYSYRVARDVEIDTPLGRLKTIHLVKERAPGDAGTEIWLSAQHANLPVKIIIIERNGVRYEQVIQSLETRD